jgi:hypothetical protein
MTYSRAFKYDVFVSYARVDDAPLPGALLGWVTTLVDALRTQLAQQLGRAEMLAIWQDLGLAGNAPVTDDIMSAVRDSAALVVVLSEGYLASQWCTDESNSFLSLAGTATRRLFIVERVPIDRLRKPAVFQDRIGYAFWTRTRPGGEATTLGVPVPTPAEPDYYRRLNRLATELADELKRMRAERKEGV